MKFRAAIFFIVLFANIIVTPTIITLVDKNQDTTIFFSLNEEEENTKHVKVVEVKAQHDQNDTSFIFNTIQKKKNVRFLSKNYISLYQKTITPPPEVVTA